MNTWKVVVTLGVAIAVGPALRAQTIDFAVAQNGGFVPVPSGSTLTLQTAGVPLGVSVQLRIRNTGAVPLTMTSITSASAAFPVSAPPSPFPLAPGDNFLVEVSYQALSSDRVVGELQIRFQEVGTGTTRQERLGLGGVAPEFRFSYVIAGDGNQVPLLSGDTIPLPPANVGASTAATVVVANVGSGPGALDAVTVSGTPFRASGLPLLPISVGAGAEFRFSAVFSPATSGDFTGALEIRSAAGNVSAVLSGRALAPSLTYSMILPDRTIQLVPGQTVVLPETAVGVTLRATVRIGNTGTSAGTVSSVSVTGSAFALSDTPPLPASIAPDGSLPFTLTAIPREPGLNTGTLRIGGDSFPLEIAGLGARFSYRYLSAGVETAVQPGGTIPLPQTQVGFRSSIRFRVENAGNQEGRLTSVSIVQTGNAYETAGVPALPVSLAPGQIVEFDVQFSPRAPGPQTASLQLNSDSIALSGTGAPPPPLPGVTYSGVSGEVQPSQQPSVGLALNAPYPVALRGQLRLQFESASFADDPSIQFATGGRVVDFQIPAGARDALFANGADRIRFQTGTVAGTISVVPSFSIDTFPITDNLPAPLRLTLPASAPQLTTLQIAAAAPGSISFFVGGSTTTRSLRSIEFTFEPTENYRNSLSGGSVTVNVEAQADTYFRSVASTGMGGMFLGTVPFALTNGGSTPVLPSEVLQSVTVTVINAIGRSNTASLSLR